MAQTVRFGVSMDAELLAAFDTLLAHRGYANRSEALRDLVRDAIVKTEWEQDTKPTTAVLGLVYDNTAGGVAGRLAAAQQKHAREILATLHLRLDAGHRLGVLVLHGPPSKLRCLADQLLTTRGVNHGQLITTNTGKHLG